MSLFDILFPKAPEPAGTPEGFFKLLNGYMPVFTSFGGGVYESERVRSAIDARARHVSKLKVEVNGSAHSALRAKLRRAPNNFHTWSQFLYRLSTILDVHNTAFIVPILDQFGDVTGIYAPLPTKCEIVQ